MDEIKEFWTKAGVDNGALCDQFQKTIISAKIFPRPHRGGSNLHQVIVGPEDKIKAVANEYAAALVKTGLVANDAIHLMTQEIMDKPRQGREPTSAQQLISEASGGVLMINVDKIRQGSYRALQDSLLYPIDTDKNCPVIIFTGSESGMKDFRATRPEFNARLPRDTRVQTLKSTQPQRPSPRR